MQEIWPLYFIKIEHEIKFYILDINNIYHEKIKLLNNTFAISFLY